MMTEAVSDILIDRGREAEGLARAVTWSFAAHALLVAAVLLIPSSWRAALRPAETTRMMISLTAGAPGPKSGGLTPIGGRPVQQVVPLPDRRPIPMTPPAAKRPEMIAPNPKDLKKPAASAKTAPEAAKGRKPSTGAEQQSGSALAETGAKGNNFGLSTGGGAGGAAQVDYANFCCPDYLDAMTQLIHKFWDAKQGVDGQTVVKFTILRDGTLKDIVVERSSGRWPLDRSAEVALIQTKQLPPLPREFPESQLTVHLTFQYQR